MKAEDFYKQRSNTIRELWTLSPKQIEYIALIMEDYAALRQPPVSGSLPTDNEIETWATYECGGCSQESNDERIGLIRGAKWMRRQILKAQGNDR